MDDTNTVLARLQRDYGDNPHYVLGQIEFYARDELCGWCCLTAQQRLTEIARVLDNWIQAHQRKSNHHH